MANISTMTDLVINRLTQSRYEQLCANNQLNPNQLYFTETVQLDADGKTVKNVASPLLSSDAANKGYVDELVSNIEIPSDLSGFSNSPNYVKQNEINISYSNQTLWLSSKSHITSVDCADFIKDGMLSSVELCSDQLIFSFNTDSEQDAISIALSNFIDETQYWKKTETSSASEISNALTSKADVSSIPLSTSQLINDSGYLTAHQSLSNYYPKTETSSATEIDSVLSAKANLSAFFDLETTLSDINGGNVQMAGVNLLAYVSAAVSNGQFDMNLATNVYRMSAPMSSTSAVIPAPNPRYIPQSSQYYYFEMEVGVDPSATSISGPAEWTWLAGGELPSFGYAGHTLYISVRFDCGIRSFLANVWRIA